MSEKAKDVVIVGGSVAGLMQGINLKRLGYNVHILENNLEDVRQNHAGGIGLVGDVLKFFDINQIPRHQLGPLSPYLRVVDKNLNLVRKLPYSSQFTSWSVLYYRLRAAFDGFTTSICLQPLPPAQRGAGSATYSTGKQVLKVTEKDELMSITYLDRRTNQQHVMHAKLVIAAEGGNSGIRRQLCPGTRREYVGYVAFRGTLPMSALSESTREFFTAPCTGHVAPESNIIFYRIPSDSGQTADDDLLLNYVWYEACAGDSEEYRDIMRDVEGHDHRYTVLPGKLRAEVWKKWKARAEKVFPATIAEPILRTTDPFVTAVTEVLCPQTTFFNGKLIMVGETLSIARPHSARSTAMIATQSLLLGDVLQGKMTMRKWSHLIHTYASWNLFLSKSLGMFYFHRKVELVKSFSSKDQDTNIPRSIVQYLESEIAKIEGELARGGHLEELNASDILAGLPTHNGMPLENHRIATSTIASDIDTPALSAVEPTPNSHLLAANAHSTTIRDIARDEAMNCGELQAVLFSILPSGPGITDLIARVRMGLTPSTAIASGSPKELRRKSSSRSSSGVNCNMLKSIPTNIMRNLIKKYMTRVYPIYPVVHAPTLWQQLDTVIRTLDKVQDRNSLIPPSYDFLIIYLMLSVSATLGSAKSGHEAKHMVFSGSLFEEGIQHLSDKAKIPSDLAGLQATLLILQYASINPRLANVWMLSGAAMRTCVELGLHREAPEALGFDKLTLDLRRRVFWSAYGFDRSICSALQRPLSIPDQTIDAHYPSVLDDRHIHPGGIDATGTETKMHMMRWVQFRKLQSQMVEVHFQAKPLDQGQSWNDWLSSMELRLHAWYDDYNDGHELTEFTLAHGLMNLHRPSPRMPSPEPRSLLKAFEAACASAKSLRDHILHGFYRRSWLIAHHILENSMVVLFCLRHGFDTISARFSAQQIFDMTKVFTANFLSLAAQGWKEVSNYAGIYERLLGPLLESVFSGRPPSLSSFGPAQDAELTRMLYPGPAQLDKLRFGSSHFYEHELPQLDMTSMNWDDFSGSDGRLSADFTNGWDLIDPATFTNTSGDVNFGMG